MDNIETSLVSVIKDRVVTEKIEDGSKADYEDGTVQFSTAEENHDDMIQIKLTFSDNDGEKEYSVSIELDSFRQVYKRHLRGTK